MKPVRVIVALAAGVALTAGVSPAAAAPEPSAHTSVIGGRAASIAEFPSAAFMIGGRGFGEFSCSGTVVAPRVVLTAGHCVDNIDSLVKQQVSDYRVTTGVANVRHPPSANVSKVTAALTYPGFDPERLLGDAGLLILAQPVAAPAIALASPAAPLPLTTGTPLQLAGWGLTDIDEFKVPDVLQTGEIAAQSPAYCKRHSRDFDPFYSPSMQICGVDLPEKTVSGCFGDSGGPAIARRPDGTQVEVGIVSAGGPFCDPEEPNIFTRVEVVADWIQGWIAAVETGAPPPVGPQAKLPRMSIAEASTVYLITMAEVLRNYGDGLDYQGGCHRLSKAKMGCGETWTEGGNSFSSSVIILWAIQHNEVALRGHYAIRRVRLHCLAGPHPKRCPVHTLRG